MAEPRARRLAPRAQRGHSLIAHARRRIGIESGTLRRWRGARWAAALALLLALPLPLSGCVEFFMGAAATTGIAVAEERSVGDAVDDLTVRAELNHLFFQENVELYQDVSFSVIEGRVLLKGSVPTPEDRVNALRLAWQATGVREVINEIQVTDEGGILDYARDTWISAQLKGLLLVDVDVLSINYSVETVNGTVYLMGIAQDEEELARVIEHARGIEDVTRVVSHVITKDDPRRPATP